LWDTTGRAALNSLAKLVESYASWTAGMIAMLRRVRLSTSARGNARSNTLTKTPCESSLRKETWAFIVTDAVICTERISGAATPLHLCHSERRGCARNPYPHPKSQGLVILRSGATRIGSAAYDGKRSCLNPVALVHDPPAKKQDRQGEHQPPDKR